MDWIASYERLFPHLGKELAIALLTLIAYVLWRFVWRQFRSFMCFLTSRSRALAAVARERTKDGPREGRGLWLHPTNKPEHYEDSFGTRVLVIANNKGGVAKTTLAANLGAFWAREWGKRVLLVDLDYQGTLSSMALQATLGWIPKGQDSVATRAISGDLEPSIFVQCAKDVPGEPLLKIIPAYYDLAQADNRLIVEWLLQCSTRTKPLHRMVAAFLVGRLFDRTDVRYNLAELLQTRAVRDAFDIVIIDCPPRVTTGAVQALCAATHILIPTILDRPSAEAVVSYCCDELEILRANEICPKLQYVGVVGTMVSPNVNRIAEQRAKTLINDALAERGFPSGLLDDRHFMRESASFVNDSDNGIAYLVMGNGQRQTQIREAMGSLAEYVAQQVGLPPPQAHTRGDQAA